MTNFSLLDFGNQSSSLHIQRYAMNRHKVLVIDDDRITVAMIRLYLEYEGYDVLAAYDGQQALEMTQAQRPDLIVLGLMLPQVGGLEVCRKLRVESLVPIVMLMARATEDDKLRGLDLGADVD
jgi:DNA-binding response OmpR family regulator